MATTQEQLDRVQTLIATLEEQGAIEEWSEASERVRRTRLADLYAREEQLKNRLAGEGGDGTSSFTRVRY